MGNSSSPLFSVYSSSVFLSIIAIRYILESLINYDMSKPHRGRIQAQGDGVEKSVSWAQDEPLSKEEGLSLLAKLRAMLSKSELKAREKQLEKAQRYIEGIEGGVDAVKKKTFLNRKTKDTRIDVEILSGTAFLAILFLIAWKLFF